MNSTFEQIIEKDGVLVYRNVGDSMLPMIKQGRDVIVIEKISAPLKRLDIPLYKRESGQYVLHRILKCRKDGYVMCGDNRFVEEYGVKDDQVIGILTKIVRNGKEISIYSRANRFYAHLICDFFFVRKCILMIKRAVIKFMLFFRKKNSKNS